MRTTGKTRLTPAACIEWMGELTRIHKEMAAGVVDYVNNMGVRPTNVKMGLAQMAISAAESSWKGDAVFVTQETMQLVAYASKTYVEDDSALFDMDLATMTRGVLFFENPLPVDVKSQSPSLQEQPIVIDAILFWDSRDDDDDPSDPVQVYVCYCRNAAAPRLTLDPGYSFLTILWMTGKTPVRSPEEKDPPGVDWSEGDVGTLSRGDLHAFLQSFWALMRQPILAEERARPIEPGARKQRKRLRNRGEVRVLRLRQHESKSSVAGVVGKKREYTCRFIVRGFWRNQAYGVGMKERKRVWIDSYVKGPADKPLVINDRVYKA